MTAIYAKSCEDRARSAQLDRGAQNARGVVQTRPGGQDSAGPSQVPPPEPPKTLRRHPPGPPRDEKASNFGPIWGYSGRTNERTNERTKTNQRTNERTIERTNERTNARTNERSNERTKERRNERTNERANGPSTWAGGIREAIRVYSLNRPTGLAMG